MNCTQRRCFENYAGGNTHSKEECIACLLRTDIPEFRDYQPEHTFK